MDEKWNESRVALSNPTWGATRDSCFKSATYELPQFNTRTRVRLWLTDAHPDITSSYSYLRGCFACVRDGHKQRVRPHLNAVRLGRHHHEPASGKFIIFASFGHRVEERNRGFQGSVSSNMDTIGCFCSNALSVHSAAFSTSPQRRWNMANATGAALARPSPSTPISSAALARSPLFTSKPASRPAVIGFQGARVNPSSAKAKAVSDHV